MSAITEYKVALIGSAGVGKTSIICRFITGEFSPKYIPTLKIENHSIQFNTTYGIIQFNVTDYPSQESFDGGYYDACIGVMDNSDLSNSLLTEYITNFKKNNHNVPVVKILNKLDTLKLTKIKKINKSKLNILHVSARHNLNLDKPFLHIARELTGILELQFIETPAIEPPFANIN